MFFLNYKNGVNYNMVAQAPQYDIESLNDLQNVPLIVADGQTARDSGRCCQHSPKHEMAGGQSLQHSPQLDIYGAVQGRDLGAVSKDVDRIVKDNEKSLPRGTFVRVRGQVETMRSLTWVCSSGWPSRLFWFIC